MNKPVVIIVNGLPGTGKTTLARRLAADLSLPVFSRDGIYEILYDALEDQQGERPAELGQAAFALLYSIAGTLIAAGQSLIIEGFFGRPALRSAEFLRLKQVYDFEPLQILCRADGAVLVERFLKRVGSEERHSGHRESDLAWVEKNKALLLRGEFSPLEVGGQVIEIDTTTAERFVYADLLLRIRRAL